MAFRRGKLMIRGILDKRFETDDEEIENTYEEKFVSHIEMGTIFI